MKNIRNRLDALYSKADLKDLEDNNKPVIRHELDRLFQHKKGTKYFPKSQVEKKAQSISDLVNGSWINTHFGDIFRAEFSYDLAEPYGSLDLQEAFEIDAMILPQVFQIERSINPQNLLFIDTETTGLSGGTGTIAFMIGLGFIEKNNFIVHQYFITQLSHEEGMLELLQKVVPNFQCLVSYNGKSFDIPLINSRFVMNRMPPMPDELNHIDLLHPTRTLWKYSMENCKLKTIETDLLGLFREGDIPGEMIPDVYFDYLRSRRIDKIERIFYHNRFDIITMLANLILIVKAHKSQHPEKNPLTDYAKARMFTRKKDIDRGINHYQYVLNSKISISRRQKTSLELAALYKQIKNYEKAIPLWKSVICEDYPFALEPFEELAKYYEHHLKNLSLALTFSKLALDKLPRYRTKDYENLIKRITRIQQKITNFHK